MPQMDRQFKEWNLSQGQFDLLAEVAVQEGTNQQSCADRLNVTKGNVAQHLKTLEERGLMRREKVGRNNQIYLTETGWDLFGSIMTPHDEYVREVLSPLSKEEVKQLSSTLRKINRALK